MPFNSYCVSALDRSDIRDFFRSMGMTLSKTVLDGLMKRFNSDSDGTVSFDEFKSMMHKLGKKPEDDQNGSFWRGLGRKLKKALTKNGVTRKLDVTFQMSDIERIEKISICRSNETQMFADSEWVQLTFAIYLKGLKDPLVVMCSKPGHAEAWEEAFCKCMELQGADDTQKCCNYAPEEWHSSTIDWGDYDGTKEERHSISKRETNPVSDWQCSTVDWGN